MKIMFFTFLTLCNWCLYAQTPDPYKFFPSSVGNVWEYSSGLRTEILRDSVGVDNGKYLWVQNYSPPLYKVDTLRNVIWDPIGGLFGAPANWLYYKLDADSGEVWIIDKNVDSAYIEYKLAKVRNVSEGYFFNYPTTFKEITYYAYQPDTIITENSFPQLTETLGYGLGIISVFDEEGGGPIRVLMGCIIDGDTIGIITSIDGEINDPNSFELFQNYPNPFNPNTTIKFNITEPQKVKLIVYSLLGEEVKVLVDEYLYSGNNSVQFNGSGLSSGVYIYKIILGAKTSSRKLILLK
ncbi:MAG: T9SS type A sorting domain-containing protein [Ignavibacteriaceae bacterium]|nr:T9SS type A sorting domain-containing protein [Ignavibacterium sp.]MCC6254999.1 T9SS type A sorting domain-containing protein [Ignavibacteriaceae bacterium]HMN23863.1 T9SS type A sorting domain-containing protein [Ignavibacteriaceae bacterium]HRN26431.1 T9SS type A sorting domain-containing protein [Ignavibacteriaceae bacterium]HRP92030.1 T9SS type A sorting domain-containing protein [Ignavibacteriaceae bacterium]